MQWTYWYIIKSLYPKSVATYYLHGKISIPRSITYGLKNLKSLWKWIKNICLKKLHQTTIMHSSFLLV